jgi:hypothetical protein
MHLAQVVRIMLLTTSLSVAKKKSSYAEDAFTGASGLIGSEAVSTISFICPERSARRQRERYLSFLASPSTKVTLSLKSKTAINNGA